MSSFNKCNSHSFRALTSIGNLFKLKGSTECRHNHVLFSLLSNKGPDVPKQVDGYPVTTKIAFIPWDNGKDINCQPLEKVMKKSNWPNITLIKPISSTKVNFNSHKTQVVCNVVLFGPEPEVPGSGMQKATKLYHIHNMLILFPKQAWKETIHFYHKSLKGGVFDKVLQKHLCCIPHNHIIRSPSTISNTLMKVHSPLLEVLYQPYHLFYIIIFQSGICAKRLLKIQIFFFCGRDG